jgi:hypothetical protein
LHALNFVTRDSIAEPAELAEYHVERFLGTFIRRARVTKDTGAVFEGLIAGIDRVAQAALLADLGKKPGRHAAGKDLHRALSRVIIRVPKRHARIGQRDLRLRGLLFEMTDAADGGFHAECRRRLALPIAIVARDLVFERRPFDIAGHRKNGSARTESFLEVFLEAGGLDAAERFQRPPAIAPQRHRPVTPTQLDHHFLPRLVFERL